jgi:hypothetical protein
MTLDELVATLRAGAEGSLLDEAAVELLIDHGCWPNRTDFVSAAIDVAPGLDDANPPLSFVDWLAALDADLPASSTERQMLSIAAELAGFDSGRPLGQLITGLDERNTALVVRAVVHASRGKRIHC